MFCRKDVGKIQWNSQEGEAVVHARVAHLACSRTGSSQPHQWALLFLQVVADKVCQGHIGSWRHVFIWLIRSTIKEVIKKYERWNREWRGYGDGLQVPVIIQVVIFIRRKCKPSSSSSWNHKANFSFFTLSTWSTTLCSLLSHVTQLAPWATLWHC